jgi:outer membrane protein assembly factor BamB
MATIAPGTGAGSGGGRRVPRMVTLAALALCLAMAALVVLLSGCSSSSKSKPAGPGYLYPNVDLSNSRHVGGPIDSASASRLKVAWSLPIEAKSLYGSYASSPVISHGVIYSQDLESNVQAIDLRSGHVLWKKSYASPDQGPDGLVVGAGRVYGATATAAFALDQKTGQQVWSVQLVRNEHEGIDMAPGYHAGLVYVSTVPGNNGKFYAAGGAGILWALDAATGRKVWHFDTVPTSLWSHPEINSGGGLWYPPAFDEQGYMYVGTGNPAPFPGTEQYPWGSSRPGPNLYTDSLVKLNAATGKVQWYYQLTPHDLYDHDLQDPPILVNAGGRQMVIAAGKSGIVVALDRASGRLLWARPVGTHNGHDQDSIYAMRHEYSKLKLPETVYPGLLGGVIAPMATNGSTVFVPVVNDPVSYSTQIEQQEGQSPTGELVALDVATGAVKWDVELPGAAFAAATSVNDLVFTTTFEGGLYALDAKTGKPVWQNHLPAGSNAGVAVDGDTVIAGAGVARGEGQKATLLAYRLGG